MHFIPAWDENISYGIENYELLLEWLRSDKVINWSILKTNCAKQQQRKKKVQNGHI